MNSTPDALSAEAGRLAPHGSRLIYPSVNDVAGRAVRTRSRRGPMSISLITEGTYPVHDGGVSVWCDQIVRGLAPDRFHIDAITVGDDDRYVWTLPDNVTSIRRVPLWTVETRRRPALGRRAAALTIDALYSLVRAVATNDRGGEFLASLEQLYRSGGDGRLAHLLKRNSTVEFTLGSMRASVPKGRTPIGLPAPTIADATKMLGLLEHLLRPLSVVPTRSQLCHATSNGVSAMLAMTAKWEYGTPFLMTEHGIYLRERYIENSPHSMPHHQRSFLLGFYKQLTTAAYATADAIAPVCDYNRRWEQANGADLDKIELIHNGIDPDEFSSSAPEPDAPTLVWVGRIDPLKDVKTLLRAFALVKAAMPGAILRIFGGTPIGNEYYLAECLDLHEQLGLGPSAVFEGRVRPIADAYLKGHAVVATSISEGFPYAVLEAMASGRATIATDVGGVWEAVGETGVLVPPQDEGALAQACLDLLRDPARRARLASAARERAQVLFPVDLCLARYGELYDDLVDAGTTRSIRGGVA